MRVEIKLSNFEECKDCPLLNDSGQIDDRYKCKLYKINLDCDVRHRIHRPQKCILDNGR